MARSRWAERAVVSALLTMVASSSQAELRYLGQQIVPAGFTYSGTTVGGLSGIDYDAARDLYYAISDDRSPDARFYTLRLDLNEFNRRAEPGFAGVAFTGVTTLLDRGNARFASNSVDPEAIRLAPAGETLVWTSEGDAARGLPAFVREMNADGTFVRELDTPAEFLPAPGRGIRSNLAFESLAFSPDRKRLYTATENALAQDGPAAGLETASPARILVLDPATGRALAEYVYVVDPVPVRPAVAGAFADNGLAELLAVSANELIAVERSFVSGVGNTIKLYCIEPEGATDVSGIDPLPTAYSPVRKTLMLDLAGLTNDDGSRLRLDNIEAITFGPTQANGHRTLILVSDNNFNRSQLTQFLAFDIAPPVGSGRACCQMSAVCAMD